MGLGCVFAGRWWVVSSRVNRKMGKMFFVFIFGSQDSFLALFLVLYLVCGVLQVNIIVLVGRRWGKFSLRVL